MLKLHGKIIFSLKLILALAIIYVAISSALLFVPRVSSEAGLAALKDQKVMADQFSKDMWTIHSEYHISSPKQRPVTQEYLVGINHLADLAARSRAHFFGNEQKFVWGRVLDDIEDMHTKMKGFGSTKTVDAKQRILELCDAMTLVLDNEKKSLDTRNSTYEILKSDKRTLYSDIRLIRTLLEAASNEHLLVHDSGRVPFADIARLQDAYWAVFQLHQQMVRDYHDSNRIATAVRVALGR
jgi:hypothetical protein